MYKLLLIAIGGAAGTLARYGTHVISKGVGDRLAFPVATLTVNLLGCLLIGFLQGALVERWPVREEYRLMLIVGFLGGFTTFSTFGWDTAQLLREGQFVRAMGYLIASNVLGIAMVFAGYGLSRHFAK
jgi:CrcB protein